MPNLFSPGMSNPKTAKGAAKGYDTLILHLAPHNLGTPGNKATVCPDATEGCISGCLNTGGQGGIGAGSLEQIMTGTKSNNVQRARIRRTMAFFEDSEAFVNQLSHEIALFVNRCVRKGVTPAVRLNGTSDIKWEKVCPELFERFPMVTFYDYTKARVISRNPSTLPSNYSLTMSYSGSNWNDCLTALVNFRNVAMVFSTKKGEPLPAKFGAFDVIDGDEHDLRFLDPRGVIVGLRAKGRAKKDTSGFVVQV